MEPVEYVVIGFIGNIIPEFDKNEADKNSNSKSSRQELKWQI